MRRQQSIVLFVSIALLVSATMIVAGCGSSSGEPADRPSEVKIAGLWPLSGSNATQGNDVLHGAELGVEIVNGAYPDIALPLAAETGLPNLGGARLALVTGDTQGKPEVGASVVDRLVGGGGITAVVGSYESGVTLTTSQRAERFGIPFVNGESSSAALTERGLKWFFRTGPSDETFATTMFDYLDWRKQQGDPVRSVGILNTNDQYGNDGAAITKKVAATRSLPVTAEVSFEPTAADLGSQVTQLRSKAPDVLFVLAYTDAAIKLMKTFQQLDYYPPALLAYGAGFSDPAFLTGTGPLANGATSRAAWAADIADRRPAAKTVADIFQKKYHVTMTENSARSFTAILALAQAINGAKSTRPGAVRAALAALKVPADQLIMPWYGIAFDAKGQNTQARGVVQQLIDGRYRVVFPAEFATAQPVWPMRQAQRK